MSSEIGIYGLTSQGINLALNMAAKGYLVTIGNKSSDKIKECTDLAEKEDLEEKIRGIKDPEDFCKNLKTPRTIILLSRPGSSVDRNMQKLVPYMESGDILIDGSCDSIAECTRRSTEVQEKGIQYVTMAITGSDEDARKGPAFLPSGPKAAYDVIEPLLGKIAAEVDGHACMGYLGEGAAAVYVKMIVDALEMSECQLLAEVYDMWRQARLNNTEMADAFADWNKTEESYLLSIMSAIVSKKDTDVDGCKPSDYFLVDRIWDQPSKKKVSTPVISESVTASASVELLANAIYERYEASMKEDRVKIANKIHAPKFDWSKVDVQEIMKDQLIAYSTTRILLYAQSFAFLASASQQNQWNLNLGEVARVLCGGSVIRCKLLQKIAEVYEKEPELTNILLSETFATLVSKQQTALRRVVSLSVILGVTLPLHSSSLAYLDSYRCGRLPGALVQCLRDALNGEGFERLDKERGEMFHCRWNK